MTEWRNAALRLLFMPSKLLTEISLGSTSISVFETSIGADCNTFVATDTFEMKRLRMSVPQKFDLFVGLFCAGQNAAVIICFLFAHVDMPDSFTKSSDRLNLTAKYGLLRAMWAFDVHRLMPRDFGPPSNSFPGMPRLRCVATICRACSLPLAGSYPFPRLSPLHTYNWPAKKRHATPGNILKKFSCDGARMVVGCLSSSL